MKQRIVTASIGLLCIIGILALPSTLPWHLLVWLCTVLGVAEFSQMFGFTWRSPLGLYAFVLLTLVEWWHDIPVAVILYMAIVAGLVWPVVLKNRVTITQSATVTLGAAYIGYGGMCLIRLRELSHGSTWIWLCLICIFATDTAAFFVGRQLKGPKLWPAISPQKTLSGAFGGIMGAVLVTVLLGYLVGPRGDVIAYVLIGVVISVVGQLGDLVESAYKRVAGVKDSGRLLPGHGGMLDRIDSLLFAAPFAYYLIMLGLPTWFR